MGRKRHTPEQIITALREAEVGLARGKSVKLISRELGITEQTYYRWEAGVRRDEGEPGTAPEGARARERAPEASRDCSMDIRINSNETTVKKNQSMFGGLASGLAAHHTDVR